MKTLLIILFSIVAISGDALAQGKKFSEYPNSATLQAGDLFLFSRGGAGTFNIDAFSQMPTALGLGTAAFTASSDYDAANAALNATNGLGIASGLSGFRGTNTFITPAQQAILSNNLNAANITVGTVPTARLGSGTANSSTFLRGDQTYATPSGGGNVSHFGSGFNGNLAAFSDDTGTSIQSVGHSSDDFLLGSGNLSGIADAPTALANIGGNNAANLSTGTLPHGRLPAFALTNKWAGSLEFDGPVTNASTVWTHGKATNDSDLYVVGNVYSGGTPALTGTSNLNAANLVGTIPMANLNTNVVTATNQPWTPGQAVVVKGTNPTGQPVLGPTNWPSGGGSINISARTNLLFFSDDFNRASLGANWTTEGTGVAYITNSTSLVVGTSGAGTGISLVKCLGWFTGTAFWRAEFDATPLSIGAATYGFSFNIRGNVNTNGQESMQMDLYTASDGLKGTTFANYSTNLTLVDPGVVNQGGQLPSLTANDLLHIVVERNNHVWTMLVTNITAGGYASLSHVSEVTLASGDATSVGTDGNSGYPSFGVNGGIIQIDNFKFCGTKPAAKWMFVGDSIPTGGRAINPTLSFAYIVGHKLTGDYTVEGNSQERLQSLSNAIPEIIALAPDNIIMDLGENDYASGRTIANVITDYKFFVTQVTNSLPNVTFWHCTPTAWTSANISLLGNFVLTNGFANVINLFSATKTNGVGSTALAPRYDCGDGTHPNALGHALISEMILEAISKNPTNIVNAIRP